MKPTMVPPGRFAYGGLERVIHEAGPAQHSRLAGRPRRRLLFTELKALCQLTDGNLSRQLSTLAEAKLVETWKGQRNNRPQTLVKLTTAGRRRFADYIAELEAVVTDARRGRVARAAGPAGDGVSF